MKTNRLLLAIILLTIVLRIPTLFEPHWFVDEGIFATAASTWLKGSKLYTDIWVNTPPGVFIIYAVSQFLAKFTAIDLLFWVKLSAGAAVLLTQIALYKLARLVVVSTRQHPLTEIPSSIITLLPPLVYGLLTSLPFWEGYLADTEIFMVPLTTWGLYLLIKNTRLTKNTNHLVAGALLGLALLIKAVALAEIFLGFLLIASSTNRSVNKIKDISLYTIGIIFPLIATSLFFLTQKNFADFLHANTTYNFFYSTLTLQNVKEFLGVNIARLLVILGASLLFWLDRSSSRLVSCWAFLSIAGASAGLRPFLHYLIQLFPPLALLSSVSKPSLANSGPNSVQSPTGRSSTFIIQTSQIFLYLLVLLVPLNEKFKFTPAITYHIDHFGYYQNFLDRIIKKKNIAEFNNYFGEHINTNSQIVSTLCTTGPATVFILTGNREPWLYYDLEQRGLAPAVPYLSSFYFDIVPHAKEQIFNELISNPPTIIITHPQVPYYERLHSIIEQNYKLLKTIDDFQIFSRGS